MGEVRKNSFIALPGKQGHSRLVPSKTVSQPGAGLGEFSEEFYSSDSRVELLIRIRMCVHGLHSFNLASNGLLVSFFGSQDCQTVIISGMKND